MHARVITRFSVSSGSVIWGGRMLRKDNVHSTGNRRAALDPVLGRCRECLHDRYFHGDAAFAQLEICEYIEREEFRNAQECKGII